MIFRSLELTNFLLSCQVFTLFQITLPECYNIYTSCIWHVPLEWHGLSFVSALLTKVYWICTTHVVRVCVSSKSPMNPNLHVNKKINLQVHFGSKGVVSLYKSLCDHSLTCFDPLFEELFSYLPTRCPSNIFDYNAYEDSDHESVLSIDSSISAFCFDDSTYLS